MKNLSILVARLVLERRKTKKISSAIRKVMKNSPPNSISKLSYGAAVADPTTTISRDSSTV